MVNLLIALVVLFATIALLVGSLLILRQMRLKKKEQENAKGEASLPMYSEKDTSSYSENIGSSSNKRSSRLTISMPKYEWNEKESLMSSRSSPTSPDVPEIRITFPEEVDEAGKRTSGRVVVVKVGEHSVGLEPVHQEDLPPYKREEEGRFQSLDLDRMGGLKEKEMR